MKTFKNYVYPLLALWLFSCQNPTKQVAGNAPQDTISTRSPLAAPLLAWKKQLALGGDPSNWPFYAADPADLDISLNLQDSLLRQDKYIKPANFSDRVNLIFGLGKDRLNADPVHLDISFDEAVNTTRCSVPEDGLRLAASRQQEHLFLSLKKGFVGNLWLLPQLQDYKTIPALTAYEQSNQFKTKSGKPLRKWSQLPDLAGQRQIIRQVLLARNRYLFLGDPTELPYLLDHDRFFMDALVEIFGYGGDPQLLEAVLAKYKPDVTQFSNGPLKLGRVIFSRDCDKSLIIRTPMLNYIKALSAKEDFRLLQCLGNFATALINGQDDMLTHAYSNEDRLKVVAVIAADYDAAFTQYRDTGKGSWPKVSLLALLFHHDPGAQAKIEAADYYGLPELKELVTYAGNFSDDFLYR